MSQGTGSTGKRLGSEIAASRMAKRYKRGGGVAVCHGFVWYFEHRGRGGGVYVAKAVDVSKPKESA